jgi:hypothetical protein
MTYEDMMDIHRTYRMIEVELANSPGNDSDLVPSKSDYPDEDDVDAGDDDDVPDEDEDQDDEA